MKKVVSVLLIALMLVGTLGFSVSAQVADFKDVPKDHWAKENIERAVAKGWFGGYPDGTFHPDQTITRAEAMTVFVKFLGVQPKTVNVSSYPDVKTTAWFSPYIEAGKKLYPPIAAYNGETPFRPDMPITREDTVYALVTALRYTDDTQFVNQFVLDMFKDKNSISEVVKPYMSVAVEKGLVSGFPDGTIGAQDPLTRAEFATMLYRGTFIGFGNSELVLDDVVTESIEVSPSGRYEMEVGESFDISAIAKMSDGTRVDYSAFLVPKTSNNNITITGTRVKAVSEGTATIQFLNDAALADSSITVVVSRPTGNPVFEELNYQRTVTTASTTISGQVKDPSGSALTLDIDGEEIPLSNNAFRETVNLEEGTNTFILTLTNSYGVKTKKTVKIKKELPATPTPAPTPTPTAAPQNATVVSYQWSVNSLSIDTSETVSIKLFEVYSDGTKKDVTTRYTLSSTNAGVAKVDRNGNVTGVSAGSAKLSFSSGGVGAAVSMPRPLTVTVSANTTSSTATPPPAGETPSQQEAVIVKYEWSVSSLTLDAGEVAAVKIFAVYSDGSKSDATNSFNITSTNSGVAKVTNNKITAVSAGTAKLSFSSGGVGAAISMPRPLTVTVKAVEQEAILEGLEWSTSSVTVKVGETTTVKLMGVYSDGSKRDLTADCDVYSDDESIATISGTTLKGVSAGTTELWFGVMPKANLSMPGLITINVIQ